MWTEFAHGGRLVVQVNLGKLVGIAERCRLRLKVHNVGVGQVDIGVVGRVRPWSRRPGCLSSLLGVPRGRGTRLTALGAPLGLCLIVLGLIVLGLIVLGRIVLGRIVLGRIVLGRIVLSQLVGQPYASLAQLAQNRPSLGRRESCLVKGRPQLRKRQVTLASAALNQVIHPCRARLVIRVGDPLGC